MSAKLSLRKVHPRLKHMQAERTNFDPLFVLDRAFLESREASWLKKIHTRLRLL